MKNGQGYRGDSSCACDMKHWSRDFEIMYGEEKGEHVGKDMMSEAVITILVQRQECLGRFLWMLSDLGIKDETEAIEFF